MSVKFRYLIHFPDDVSGTNDEALAKEFVGCADALVIDVVTGVILHEDGTEILIEEVKVVEDDSEEQPSDNVDETPEEE